MHPSHLVLLIGQQGCAIVTTRQPVVAELIGQHLCCLSDQEPDEAFQLLTTGLPALLIQQSHASLEAICASRRLPLELLLIGEALRRAAPTPYLFRETLTHYQRRDATTQIVHLYAARQGYCLADAFRQIEMQLSPALRAHFRLLVNHFLEARFGEQDLARVGGAREMLGPLRDAGLLEWRQGRYAFHPLVVAYATSFSPQPG